MVRVLGLATYWQSLLDEGKFTSLTEIAKADGIDRAYVSRVFKLTRGSVLEAAVSLKAPPRLAFLPPTGSVPAMPPQKTSTARSGPLSSGLETET